jgi:hypothetical protein
MAFCSRDTAGIYQAGWTVSQTVFAAGPNLTQLFRWEKLLFAAVGRRQYL